MRRITSSSFIRLAFLFLSMAVPVVANASQDSHGRNPPLLPESVARRSVIEMVMPVYPERAVRRGISRVVPIKIEISGDGDVLRIKFKPRTEPLLKEAVSSAARQWRFKPWLGSEGVGVAFISRLTFDFVISNGEPRVEMYDHGRDAHGGLCLGCSDSGREFREWREWEEVSIKK